jgi:6,7-dimethyl-8-ribityllumazine synthase
MLTLIRKKNSKAAGTFAIIASEYNALYVDAMVRAAQSEFRRAGARNVKVLRVPGAFEIPVVAARLARQHAAGTENGVLALVCLGVILRGETTHASHIGEAVTQSLMQIQVRFEVPTIHEVLLLENEQQARVRCLGRKHNRGAEAAQTALAMAAVMNSLGT